MRADFNSTCSKLQGLHVLQHTYTRAVCLFEVFFIPTATSVAEIHHERPSIFNNAERIPEASRDIMEAFCS